MGYFSNATEGEIYEATWCRRCVHYERGPHDCCPVWLLHIEHNHDQTKKPATARALAYLIPRDAATGENLECNLFSSAVPAMQVVVVNEPPPMLELFDFVAQVPAPDERAPRAIAPGGLCDRDVL